MKIIREFVEHGGFHMLIRTNTYTSSIPHFDYLCRLAATEFPDITRDDITIKQYGGDTIKHTFGIEFSSDTAPPETFNRIYKLPYTL